MKNKANKRSIKQKLSVLAFIALYLITPLLTNVTAQSAFATESIPVPISTTTGNEYDENGLLSPGAAKTESTVPTSPYEHPTMSLIEQETQSSNSLASQEVNRNLNNEFANYNETYSGLNQFWNDTIVGKFFNNFLPWIGKNVSEFLYSWIPSAVQYLSRALEIFVLNPNIAVNGLSNDPRMTISNTPAAQEGQTYINAIAPEVRKLADIMYGIAVDLLLLLFVLCIWKFWADASWGRGGSNLMGAVGRLITTSALMLAWPTIYAFWIQISNEMIKAIYFNSASEMVAFDQAMATVIKGGLLAIGGLLLNALAPVAGSALGGLVGGPVGGLVGGTIGGFVAFAGLIIFMVFGAILIAQLVYLVTLKAIQTILLTAQYMFAPIFLVMFATPDTENACAGFVKSFVEVSLWSFVWVGFLRLLVVIMNTDFSPWGKVVLGLGILQLMISVPAFIARAQISPMSDFLSAGMITGGLVKGAAAVGSTANLFMERLSQNRFGSHLQGGAPGAVKAAAAGLNPAANVRSPHQLQGMLFPGQNVNPAGPGGPGTPGTDGPAGGITPVPPGPGGPKGNKGGPTATTPTGTATPPIKTGTPDPNANKTIDPNAAGKDPNAKKSTPESEATKKAQQAAQAEAAAKAKAEGTTGAGEAGKETAEIVDGKTTPDIAGIDAGAGAGAAAKSEATSSYNSLMNGMDATRVSEKESEGNMNLMNTITPFTTGVQARGEAEDNRSLARANFKSNKGNAILGSTKGGIGAYRHQPNAAGNVNEIQAAKMQLAGALGPRLVKDNEMAQDAARASALKAGAHKPKGLLDRALEGHMYYNSGKTFANTPRGQEQWNHALMSASSQGALQWLEGTGEDDPYTQFLNETYGPCTPEAEAELVGTMLDSDSVNSGYGSSAVAARKIVQQNKLPWTLENNAAAAAPAYTTAPNNRKAVANQAMGVVIKNMLEDRNASDMRSGKPIAGSGIQVKRASNLSKDFTPHHVAAITSVAVGYDLGHMKNYKMILDAADTVENTKGSSARESDYLAAYTGSLIHNNMASQYASGSAQNLEFHVGGSDDSNENVLHSGLGMDEETITQNVSQNMAGGSVTMIGNLMKGGLNSSNFESEKVITVATQVDQGTPVWNEAFVAAANSMGSEVTLPRVHVAYKMIQSDSRSWNKDSIGRSDLLIAEAIAQIQSANKLPVYVPPQLVSQVSKMMHYNMNEAYPQDGYHDTVVQAIKSFTEKAQSSNFESDFSGGGSSGRRGGGPKGIMDDGGIGGGMAIDKSSSDD